MRDYPHYGADRDYTTNAPSYYDDLARKNELIKHLAKRVWEFDKTLFESLEEVNRVLNETLRIIGEGFNAEIEKLLIQWVEDGTLDHIINVTLMNKKADITYVDAIEKKLAAQIAEVVKQLSGVSGEVDKLKQAVPENHYVSTAFPTLQDAVFGAEGGTLYVKPGTYMITKPIKIRSNTTIIAHGVTFRRNADMDVMFINDSDGTKGGYTASRNIEIIGGTIDASGGTFQDKCTMVAFGHAENIKILDMTFRNLIDWHMLELNSVRNVLVEHCLFENYGNVSVGTEMLQIDIARGTAQFPWFGPYDNTTCDNIMIKNNVFQNGVRGVGTHSSTDGKEHTRITIKENDFLNLRSEAIYGLDWAFTKIHSNHMRNVKKGIHLRVSGRNVYNHSILDNYLSGLYDDPNSRGIEITGIKDGFGINAGTIKNNKVKRFGGHGIGVDYCGAWNVDGNEVTSSGKAGIIIYGSWHVTVTHNVSRTNAVLGSDNDITAVAGSNKVIFTGNICDSMTTTSAVSEALATGNIVHVKFEIVGSQNHKTNNIVAGVLQA